MNPTKSLEEERLWSFNFSQDAILLASRGAFVATASTEKLVPGFRDQNPAPRSRPG
jgi:hypothetical protein